MCKIEITIYLCTHPILRRMHVELYKWRICELQMVGDTYCSRLLFIDNKKMGQ
jgi:hypothetical protein